MTYVGKTGEQSSIRLKEYEASQRLKDDNSQFEKHTNDKDTYTTTQY